MRVLLHILILFVLILLPAIGNAESISAKLPRIEFEETPLSDVVEFLRLKSVELDPTKAGINFLIDPKVDQEKHVSLHLSDVTVGTALVCLIDHARLDYRIDNHACLILPSGEGELAKKVPREAGATAKFGPAIRAREFQMDRVEFVNAPLKDVVAYLSNRYKEENPKGPGFNIVLSSMIDADIPVSMKLSSVPASTVLYYVSKTTGVEIRIEPHAIFIDPPGTKALHIARIEAERRKNQASAPKRKRGKGYTLGSETKDPRSPTHPDYVHSSHPVRGLRSNSLNNVYKWVGGKWTFVRYGSGDPNKSSLDAAKGLSSSPIGTRK